MTQNEHPNDYRWSDLEINDNHKKSWSKMSFSDWDSFVLIYGDIADCDKFPKTWGKMLVDKLAKAVASPSGKWQDYNCLQHAYYAYSVILQDFVCLNDLPDKPEVPDYSEDLTSPSGTDVCT